MKNLSKLGLATILLGASVVPTMSANAVTATATYNLIPTPVIASVSETTQTAFGDVNIPASGEAAATKTHDTNGVFTISNAADSKDYTLTIGAATCGTGVTLAPTATCNSNPIATGGTLSFVTAATTITLAGTLTVTDQASGGGGTCTYDVAIASAG